MRNCQAQRALNSLVSSIAKRWISGAILVLLATQSWATESRVIAPNQDLEAKQPLEFTLEAAARQKLELDELACHLALGIPHNVAFGAALGALTPLEGNAFGLTAWSLNLALKACPPALDTPAIIEKTPAAGVCRAKIRRPATTGEAKNIFGTQLAVSGDWGEGGAPQVFGFNTDVRVTSFFGNDGLPPQGSDGLRTLQTGLYSEQFLAENLASGWDFVFIPSFKFPKGIEKFLGGPGGREAAEFVFSIAVEAGLFAGDFTNFLFPSISTGSIRGKTREIAILDVYPPVASVSQNEFDIEALELGGASIRGATPSGSTNRVLLRSGFTVTDDCDNQVELLDPEPPFWPIGERTQVVWKAMDNGPNRDRIPNVTEIIQFVNVVDTLPPVIVAPPDRVVETSGQSVTVTLQPPRVFDFGDTNPDIALEGELPPETIELPRGVNELMWSATDDFGQSASVIQHINVKGEGENNAPQAAAQTVSAISFDATEIVLGGTDPDVDPLTFRISKFPPNGGFEAPLLPYFIEDFRGDFESASACDENRAFDVLADPDQVKITDAGLTFILDCEGPGETDGNRISVLSAERELIAGRSLPRSSSVANGIYQSPSSGEIFYAGNNGSAGPRFFRLDPLTLETIAEYRVDPATPFGGINAFMIDDNELLFVTQGRGDVIVFDLADVTDEGDFLKLSEPVAQFDLDPLETAGGGFRAVRDIALTYSSELLFLSAGRIHRMLPSSRRTDGTPVVGEITGWLGACASGEGCDLSRNASRGYSCTTGVTCNTGEQEFFGPNPGQLREGASLGVDTRNNVYVADFGNARVQRFTDDGVFGGQAQSVCPSDQRCFVLGDFGRPSVISVNSRNLYVLDRSTDVVHAFETSVIDPIDDTSARVLYTSNDGFTGTDTFTFASTDGLDFSTDAAVNVNVSRNFRAPVADELRASGFEDTPLAIRLSATDPDGALDLPLAYEVLSQPEIGTISGTPPVLVYTPPLNWYGSTSLTFRASDGRENSAPATVNIEIEPVNDPPTIELVSVGADDPTTSQIEVTAGYPTNFAFRYSDVDDVDLHRFDIDWSTGNPGQFAESDVIEPDEDNASPLLVGVAGGGEIVADFTFPNASDVSTVRACVSDNVVLNGGAKQDSTTTLTSCINLATVQTPRPELDVEVIAPAVIPGQEQFAQIELRVTNRPPQSGAGEDARSVQLTATLPAVPVDDVSGCTRSGKRINCDVGTLADGGSYSVTYRVDVSDLAEGADLPITIDASAITEVSSPTRTSTVITKGPVADVIVNTFDPSESDCQFECPRNGDGCTGATAQQVCSFGEALGLVQDSARGPGNPIMVLGNGSFEIEGANYFVNPSVNIIGLGSDRTIVSGSRETPILEIRGPDVVLSNLSLSGGFSDNGGSSYAIDVAPDSQLTLDNVVVSNSQASAIIRSRGDLVMNQVALVDNTIGEYLIEANNQLTMTNVIMMDNTHSQADTLGLIGNLSGTVQLNHVTAVNNGSPVLYSLPGAGFMEISNSLFADDTEPACRTDAITAITSSGGNVYRPGSGCPMGAGDVQSNAALLALRQQVDGLPIAMPLAASPAVDLIASPCIDVDLLSVSRPLDGNEDGQLGCDAGALERPREIFADGFEF